MNTIAAGEMAATYGVISMSMNILAMFGVFHLNKDHTYRTGDNDMERIGRSYLNTLRTISSSDIVTLLYNNQLDVVRTAPHPFGLAQTYWLFRVMHRENFLAAPLAIRNDVRPPPLSRLEVVNAAKKEWTNLPIGSIINRLYAPQITVIEAMRAEIGDNAPAYSSLYRLYGVDTQSLLSEPTNDAITAMMPCVYGFSFASHTLASGTKEGLALARCFDNLLRDNRAVAEMWHGLWDTYLATSNTKDLATFVAENMSLLEGGVGGGQGGQGPVNR
jgi:hypothetical protein